VSSALWLNVPYDGTLVAADRSSFVWLRIASAVKKLALSLAAAVDAVASDAKRVLRNYAVNITTSLPF